MNRTLSRRLAYFVVPLIVLIFVPRLYGQGTNDSRREPVLYTLGIVAASNLYSSYAMLGTVADGYTSGGYDATTSIGLAKEIIALSSSSSDALQQLIDTASVIKDDLAIIENMIEAHQLIVKQAEGLLLYIDDATQSEAFRTSRTQAWEKISAILDAPNGN